MTDNPFRNARIVGTNVPLAKYLPQPDGVTRGDPRFIMHSSELRAFSDNPQKWILTGQDRAQVEAEAEEAGEDAEAKAQTKAQAWGSLVDCLLTTPDHFQDRYAVTPATYENSKREDADWTWKSSTCREWRDLMRTQGMEVVTPDELEQGKIGAGRLAADPEIAKLIRGAAFQVHIAAEYEDEATNLVIPVRCLIDVVPAKFSPYGTSIANLKTTHDGRYEKWQRAIEDHGYDMQGALEFDLYNAAMPDEGRCHYLHPIQESKPPYVIGRRELGQDGFLHIGREKYKKALAQYCLCLAAKTWPGYDDPFPGQYVLNNGWTIMEPKPWQLGKVM